jgi:hypothetical protein
MSAHRRRAFPAGGPGPALALLAGLLGLGCASLRLAGLDPLPTGEPFRGPEGSYTLTAPSDQWVRTPDNEGERIDLALARKTGDAWLNVSVLPGRFATPEQALAHARTQADALMQTVSRDERDATVPAPEGDLPARFGRYCGTFDRELRSRESCFVLLATIRGDTTYALVGQVRVQDPLDGREPELERLVRSLRLVDDLAADPARGDEDSE